MRKKLVIAAILGTVSLPAAAQTNPSADPLATRPGWQAGGQISGYRYEEPNGGAKLSGARGGPAGVYTYDHAGQWFFRADGRYSYGKLRYEGSGTKDSVPDSILEIRGVFGKDFFLGGGVSLSPYAGLGHRFLYNDLRGTTSSGTAGYRRYSNYLYAPLGLTSRFSAGDQWVIAATVEYDYFIRGRQVSLLTDANSGYGDAYNTQRRGRGYRLSVMAEKDHWAFGPWMHYWSIEDSDVVWIAPGVGGMEPKNWTREAGVEVRYRF
ncbi:MAG: hypothetical protein WA373_08625 [Burkholderiales bacterium]